ncbi:MAG: hypothetical protein Q7S18_03635 [bacterium]|nr:hypothetical protein [bacterium]
MEFEEDDIAPKNTSIAVKYKDTSASVDVIVSAGICPIDTVKGTAEVSANFSLINTAFAVLVEGEWEIGVNPSLISLAEIKERKKLLLDICIKKPDSVKIKDIKSVAIGYTKATRNGNSMTYEEIWVKPPKFSYSPGHIFIAFPYEEKIIAQNYAINIEAFMKEKDNTSQKISFRNVFKITGEKCTNIVPGKLNIMDNRIPVVIVAQEDFIGYEEEFKKRVDDEYSLLLKTGIYDPITVDAYTLWRSETIGSNACQINGPQIVIWLFRNSSSNGALGLSTLGGSRILIYDKKFREEKNMEGLGALTVAHELGHVHGFLLDEYYLSDKFTEGKSESKSHGVDSANCAGVLFDSKSTEIIEKHKACEYFRNKITDPKESKKFVCDCVDVKAGKGFDINKLACERDSDVFFDVFRGCNLIEKYDYQKTGWYRSMENGVMYFAGTNIDGKMPTFGPVGRSLFREKLKSIRNQ